MTIWHEKRKEEDRANRCFKMMGRGKPEGSQISENTKKEYLRRIKRVWRLIEPEKPFKSVHFVFANNTKKIVKAIEDSDMPISSKTGLFAAMNSLYHEQSKGQQKNGKAEINRYMRIYSDKIKEENRKQEKNPKQNKVWATKEELSQGEEKLLAKAVASEKLQDYYYHFLYSLYAVLPARRALDYGSMRINPDPGFTGNAIYTQPGKGRKFQKFVFKQFKLSNKKDNETFDREFMKALPDGDAIITILDSWLMMNRTKFLLLNEKSANLMTNTIKRLSKRTFGRALTINTYRHIYIGNFLDSSPYLLEKELVSAYMSHSTAMEETYRKRDVPGQKEDFVRLLKEVKE